MTLPYLSSFRDTKVCKFKIPIRIRGRRGKEDSGWGKKSNVPMEAKFLDWNYYLYYSRYDYTNKKTIKVSECKWSLENIQNRPSKIPHLYLYLSSFYHSFHCQGRNQTCSSSLFHLGMKSVPPYTHPTSHSANGAKYLEIQWWLLQSLTGYCTTALS